MMEPEGFYWLEKPHLAGLARPASEVELVWLRQQGIELLVSLTEEPPPRRWINEAGLFHVHVPVVDMEAPTQEQLDQCISAIQRIHEQGRAAAVHCTAGLGRTGTILAAYLVHRGMPPAEAMDLVRTLRPGSIETAEQEDAILEYARRRTAPPPTAASDVP